MARLTFATPLLFMCSLPSDSPNSCAHFSNHRVYILLFLGVVLLRVPCLVSYFLLVCPLLKQVGDLTPERMFPSDSCCPKNEVLQVPLLSALLCRLH